MDTGMKIKIGILVTGIAIALTVIYLLKKYENDETLNDLRKRKDDPTSLIQK